VVDELESYSATLFEEFKCEGKAIPVTGREGP
jgi:hypothetical protein